MWVVRKKTQEFLFYAVAKWPLTCCSYIVLLIFVQVEFKWHTSSTHCCDIIMDAMASQITSLAIVYSIVHSGADQRKHQRSASLAFVRGIHRWPVNSPHKWPVTRKCFHLMTLSYDTTPWAVQCFLVDICQWDNSIRVSYPKRNALSTSLWTQILNKKSPWWWRKVRISKQRNYHIMLQIVVFPTHRWFNAKEGVTPVKLCLLCIKPSTCTHVSVTND